MNKHWKRLLFNYAGLWLGLLAVTLLLARRGWLVEHKPAHPDEIAEELGSIYQFPFTIFPDHSDTRFVFKQLNETGTGIYLYNTAGGKRTLVCQQDEKGWSWQAFVMLGWSPDDHYFACAFPPHDPQQPKEEILVCDGASGEIVARLKADWKIAELAWLSPRSLAYSYSDSGQFSMMVLEQKSEKEWIQTHLFKQAGGKDTIGLVATSPASLAWQQGNSLWTLDFASGTPQKIWESATNQLVNFSFSEETKEFLLNCADDKGQFLIRFYPPTKWTADAGRINDQTNAVPKAVWFNKGTRYAWLSHDDGRNTFYIKANNSAELVRLPWPGEVTAFTMDGNHLFISGYVTNGMPGIWQYDFNSAELNHVVPSSERGLKYAGLSCPVGELFTNALGEPRACYLWPPIHASSSKKYPVVVSQGLFRINPYPQATANEGFYYAMVGRPSWMIGIQDWQRDISDACNFLAKNPNIDTNQIFLTAMSAETGYLCQLIKEKPNMCNGVILVSPTALPDLSDCKLSSILIICGTADGDALQRLPAYQNQAAEAGIYVQLFFVPDAGHIAIRSIGGDRAQLQYYAKFLSEN